MDPQLYIEIDTEAELLHWEEWACRCYAADNNVVFPIPDDPPSLGLTYLYLQGTRKPGEDAGGVVRLDDELMRFAVTTEFTLTDETVYAFDIVANAKTYEQLSEAGKLLYPPYVPPEE
jgi:hypothetical protein